MKCRRLNINNEFNKLKSVLMALSPEKIYSSQQKILADILLKYDVEIIWADIVPDAKYQLFVRDPFIVIKDTIMLSYMKEEIRQLEFSRAETFLRTVDHTKKIVIPNDIVIEGGDVIPHDDILFVGQGGMRTDNNGLKFLEQNFSGMFNVVPIDMQFDKNKESWLHLDCVFNPIWHDTAIVFPAGIKKESIEIIESIFPNLIKITEQEKKELAANVFSLGNKTVIVQNRHTRIIEELKTAGFIVETIDLYATVELDGYSRCMTCPIERD